MSKEQILIVEDEAIVAIEIRETLERHGYNVLSILDRGEKVLEAVAALKPDLIIMDIKLNNGMDGIEAAFQTQAEFDIPIIYLSAYFDEDTLSRASVTSPAAYLIKPFNERELAANVALALVSSRAKSSTLDRLRGNEPLLDALDMPALLLDSGGLIVYANRLALSYLRIRDLSFIRNDSITRFVDIGTREEPDRPCLIVAADGSTDKAVVTMEALTLSNGDQIGAMVVFQRMSGKERNFLESAAGALNEAILANLPAFGSAGNGYHVKGFLLPCLSGTGDFYDVFPIGETHFCFYALDVMGHGPLAALIAWSLRDLIRTIVSELGTASPVAILRSLNQYYRERNFVPDSFFISMLLGTVERDTGTFKIARAGYPPCLHIHPDGSLELLKSQGTALGIAPEVDVEELTGTLDITGRLVLFSNGIIESYAQAKDRLDATVRRISDIADHSLSAFVGTLSSEARDQFSGDDSSLLVIERCVTHGK